MTSSWEYKPIYDPNLGNGYVSVIEQIWVELRNVAMAAVSEINLANIVLGYAEIDDFYVFSEVLAIHVPGIATLPKLGNPHSIYLGSYRQRHALM